MTIELKIVFTCALIILFALPIYAIAPLSEKVTRWMEYVGLGLLSSAVAAILKIIWMN